MTKDQKRRCDVIIHSASGIAGLVGGVAPIPGSDAVLIMPVQVGMVIQLGRVFDVAITQSAARSAVLAALAQILGRGSARVITHFIPGVRNVVNGAVAVTVTEALGWTVAGALDSGSF